ncbi:hypothetical protein H2200_002904 [Cladophialophora chaetospira]|uniref:Uncharacterized protein n=1 Tax=Cladophialophora chaetospira TaxID=386627 RepID=A0AA39CM85_9EURO|nr:hypothetical protein H2200_002904 [Cladophialophora chaetospira]
MEKTPIQERPELLTPTPSYHSIPIEYEESEYYKEVLPAYREELEFNKEIGTVRDQAIKDEKDFLELNGQLGQYEDEVEDVQPLQPTESDPLVPTDEEMLAEALSFAKRKARTLRSADGTFLRLEKPVVIPQVRNGVGVPFSRAFSEALTPYDITEAEWLAFLDNLNVVATANPPLQMMDMVGNVIGFIPHEWAMAAGTAISAVATVGIYIVSKQRTDRFMVRSNDEFFAPRGLKATLCTTEALYKILGLLPEDVDPPSLLSSIPFFRRSSSRVNLVPLEGSKTQLSIQERRVKGVEAYVAPLTFEVPPPAPQTNTLRKICAWQVKHDAKSAEKRLLKARKRKQQRHKNWQSPAANSDSPFLTSDGSADPLDPRPAPRKSSSTSSKAAAVGITALSWIVPLPHSMTDKTKSSRYEERSDRAKRRYERDLSRGRSDHAESKYNREMGRLDKQKSREMERLERDDKEEKAHRKILWVLVQNLDAAVAA